MTQVRRAFCALAALALLSGCGDKSTTTASLAPAVNLDGVTFPEGGLPDPCEVLRAANVKELLVRPLEEQPTLAQDFCLIQVARGERFELQTSAALELTLRDISPPTNLDEYVEQYGEGLVIAGCTRDDAQVLPGLGDFSVWFPHKYPPGTTTITLSSFWGERNFLSLEIHRVDREVALAWAKEIAAQLISRIPPAEAERFQRGASQS